MPYEAQSPLGAAIGAITGFLGGRMQAQTNEQQRQDQLSEIAFQHAVAAHTQKNEDARLKLEQDSLKQKHDDQLRTVYGLDPATGKPMMVPQAVSGMKVGQGGKFRTPGWYSTVQAEIAKYAAIAQSLIPQQGIKGPGVMNALTAMKTLQAQLDKARADDERERVQNRSFSHADASQARTFKQQKELEAQRAAAGISLKQLPTWADTNPTYRDLHPRTGRAGKDTSKYSDAVRAVENAQDPVGMADQIVATGKLSKNEASALQLHASRVAKSKGP